eukprot:scaffold91472_cov31-Tisochrysis_lutea.AAC.4
MIHRAARAPPRRAVRGRRRRCHAQQEAAPFERKVVAVAHLEVGVVRPVGALGIVCAGELGPAFIAQQHVHAYALSFVLEQRERSRDLEKHHPPISRLRAYHSQPDRLHRLDRMLARLDAAEHPRANRGSRRFCHAACAAARRAIRQEHISVKACFSERLHSLLCLGLLGLAAHAARAGSLPSTNETSEALAPRRRAPPQPGALRGAVAASWRLAHRTPSLPSPSFRWLPAFYSKGYNHKYKYSVKKSRAFSFF